MTVCHLEQYGMITGADKRLPSQLDLSTLTPMITMKEILRHAKDAASKYANKKTWSATLKP